MREKKFQFVFQHPESKEVIISGAYCLNSIMGVNIDEIQETVCDCDCQPLGEASYKDCNCDEYYMAFVPIADRQYAGFKDRNGREIYEGDIVREDFRQDGSYCSTGVVEFYEGSFGSRNEHDRFRIPALLSGKAVEGMNLNYYEVIGNIHQNPELLTAVKA